MKSRLVWMLIGTVALGGCSGRISAGFGRPDGGELRDGEVPGAGGSGGSGGVGSDGGGVGPDGCVGSECNNPDVDGGANGLLDGGIVDLTEGPVGGVLFDDEVLESEAFGLWRTEVQPLLVTECGTCHLGQRFAFASLHRAGSEFTEDETIENYKTFFPMISLDNPPLSRLLTKLLPAATAASQQHGDNAEAQVTGTDDPTYVTLLKWIDAEKERRCSDCGITAPHAYIAYVDRPDTHWAIDRTPIRSDYGYRHGAKIMLQRVDPATGTPADGWSPIEFLPSSFCGASGACDFGWLSSNYRGNQLVFECRLSLSGQDWLDLAWNICVAEIGGDGKAINPRFVRPAGSRPAVRTAARSDPYMLTDSDGAPLEGYYDEHARMRSEEDRFPIYGPDDSRIFLSSRGADPRTGVRGSETYHGFQFTNNIISMGLDGADPRSVYLNEGGAADQVAFLRNGNLAIHTWNLERMDRHLYTQSTQDGMMELPVLLGHVQGSNMWGSLAQLPGGALIGISGRRRSSVEHFNAFVADHTLGTGVDSTFTSFVELDPEIETELGPDIALCSSPPDGANCSTSRFYDDAAYAPLDGALVSHNPVRTYYMVTGVDDNRFQDAYGNGKGDFASIQAYLPEQRIALIDRKGVVRELIQPGANRALRFPTWVGRRQAPLVHKQITDETQNSAELHIADVPLWLMMELTREQNMTTRLNRLDAATAVRVLVKIIADNECTNDGETIRASTYRGSNGGTVDHPTHLGANNSTGYMHLKVPQALGGDAYGNVPIKADRSVRIRVPAGQLLLIQAVDTNGHMVAQHTRVFSMPPGHSVDTSIPRQYYAQQCMACHGAIGGATYTGITALGKLPAVMDFNTQAKAADVVDLTDPSVQAKELTFLHALRPVLDSKCVSCHSGASPAGELTLESTYSSTANYPAGRWAQTPHIQQAYLNAVPAANRVPGYNWSVARTVMLERAPVRAAFIPDNDPYIPQGALAPWDPGYQMMFISDPSTANRFYYLSDYEYGIHVGRGGRWSDTAYLLEVLTDRDLAERDYAGAQDHVGMLTEAELRTIMALIDNGMPYMARCSDKTVASGPNAGEPWGEPTAKNIP